MASFFKKLLSWLKRSSQEELQDVSYIDLQEIRPGQTGLGKSSPIGKIKKVKSGVLGYSSRIGSSTSGEFEPPEYDLAEVGVLEDSVSGHRLTAVKIEGELKTLTFEQLWKWGTENYPIIVGSDGVERIFIDDSKLEVLSGKITSNLSNEEAKAKRICKVAGCQEEYGCSGVCERHRWQLRTLGYVLPTVVGSWEKCTKLIRHRVSKKGVHFLQKGGSSEVTNDHSFVSLEESGFGEFKPEERKNLVKIQGINWSFGQIETIDLEKECQFSRQSLYYSCSDKVIKYCHPNPLNREACSKKAQIRRYITPDLLLDFCALLGAFISEGSTKNNGNRQFRIHNTDLNWLNDLQTKFERLFPEIPSTIVETNEADPLSGRDEPCFALSCNYEIISKLFSTLCGYQCENKKLPDFVYQLPKEAIFVINKYLLDGDGHRESYGFSCTTKSLTLASQYSFLLRLLGLNANFNYRFNHDRLYYSVRTCLYKEHLLCKKTWYFEFNYQDEYVYDLEVPSTKNFVDLAGQVLLHNTESFVHQAIWKKVALLSKEGFDFTSTDPATLDYVNTRLAQIARASSKPTGSLLRDIGASLVRLNNAFLYKKRDVEASGGKVRTTSEGKTLKPVAAYFAIPAETMRVELDEVGNVVSWRQEMPDGRWKDYRKEDIIHFRVRAKEGFVFAKPDLIPVIDDIRALRNIEENIELLIHQHLFPLFQYIVGTENRPAGTTEAGEDEIEVVKRELQEMPAEGGIVTPERHEIKAIGAEGRALRIEGYIDHFKKRVIAGLGISSIDLGDGGTVNRATSRTLSRQLIDTVKDLQDAIEEQFGQEVISELLQESSFNFDVLHPRHMVKLQFREIDLENRIEKEKHASEMFEANGLTYPEYRAELGREPILIPEDPEDQDPKKYPDWHQTHWKLFGEPEMLIKAVDEPFSPSAKAAASSRSLALTSKQLAEGDKEQKQKEKVKADEDRKTKLAIASKKKKSSTKDSLTPKKTFDELEKEIVELFKGLIEGESEDFFISQMMMTVGLWVNDIAITLSTFAFADALASFSAEVGTNPILHFDVLWAARKEIEDRCHHFIDKLGKEVVQGVKKIMHDSRVQKETLSTLQSLFDSLRYRIGFIYDAEMGKASSYGKLLGMRVSGAKRVEIFAGTGSCETCIKRARVYSVDELFLDNIIPYHAHCNCQMKALKEKE